MTLEATAAPLDPAVVDPNASDPAGAAAPADTTDANAAASSTVDEPDAKEPRSLLSVIQDAVKPADAVDPSPTKDSEVDPAAIVEADPAEAVVTDDADLPFHNHPRWKEVIAERDAYKPNAERYDNITSFMAENGLMADEVAEGFEIMALLKSGDPVKLSEARDWFQSRLTALDEGLGNVLPSDLADKVDAGLIDEEGAQELSRTRAAEKLRGEQATAREAAATASADTDARTQTAVAMATAVNNWEARTKATDPDYSKKAALVQTTCQAIVQRTGKAPASVEEAIALTDQALGEVNKQLAAMLPKPRPIVPGPHGSSTPTAAEPKTLREAINAAVAR